jgi:type IV pilus assembly protein PilM
VVKAGAIIKPDQLGQILKGIAVKQGGGEVYVSLPEEFAYIYPVSVNAQQGVEQMKSAVEFSLSEHVPLPEQQIVFDSVPISGVTQTKSKYISVTAYDSKKSIEYIELVTRAGFIVRAAEPEVHAAVRACVSESESGTVLLMDFGRSRTGITAVLNGTPISTSTIEEGGRCITNALVTITGGDIAKADALKHEHGFAISAAHPGVADAFLAATTAWAQKIKEYVTFLSESHPTYEVPMPAISKIVLCGGEAAIPGFPEWLQTQLNMPVSVADVWGKLFSYSEHIPTITKAESMRLATAAGLLLRNLEE